MTPIHRWMSPNWLCWRFMCHPNVVGQPNGLRIARSRCPRGDSQLHIDDTGSLAFSQTQRKFKLNWI